MSKPANALRFRAALYVRVSGGDGQTTANQVPDLERLAGTRGYEVVEAYDEVASAVKVRPAFEAMMKAARSGKFNVLVIWSLDRFGRSMTGNIEALLELDRVGVQVVSVQEPWLDTGGPVRSLLIAIFSWVAEQERARLIERTKAGLDRARRQGKRIGRPPARVDLPRALAMRAQGVTLRESARLLGVGPATLHRALGPVGDPKPPSLATS